MKKIIFIFFSMILINFCSKLSSAEKKPENVLYAILRGNAKEFPQLLEKIKTGEFDEKLIKEKLKEFLQDKQYGFAIRTYLVTNPQLLLQIINFMPEIIRDNDIALKLFSASLINLDMPVKRLNPYIHSIRSQRKIVQDLVAKRIASANILINHGLNLNAEAKDFHGQNISALKIILQAIANSDPIYFDQLKAILIKMLDAGVNIEPEWTQFIESPSYRSIDNELNERLNEITKIIEDRKKLIKDTLGKQLPIPDVVNIVEQYLGHKS